MGKGIQAKAYTAQNTSLIYLSCACLICMGVWSEGDHREWYAIRAWTESLPILLAPKKQID